ncbi:MAG: helix-hairpin-helix domain-containing protein [Gammaproteobacteria bacterium]|nr:helix-hairpin-helix domain-containing protein [Gammaproteobacteria bacterium]MCP5135783.1 helix-hairpin-helix domain-containing protein [Gammaproteobacteria bacterium]
MPRPITDVPGIGPAAAELLASAGIKTADALAKASVAEISAVKTFGPIRAAQVKVAATELLSSAVKPEAKRKTAKTTAKPETKSDTSKPAKGAKKKSHKKAKKKDGKKSAKKKGDKKKSAKKKGGKKKNK